MPVSPRISTVESRCATLDAISRTRSKAFDRPTMLSNPYFSIQVGPQSLDFGHQLAAFHGTIYD